MKSYPDFTTDKELFIEELQCTLTELTHKSGAKILHIGNEDPENVFCLSFRTYPNSSNGVAHILEHTVLCGSEKFPVKDPFFGMNRRSLNTFMNAFTGSDFTCYPAASQVKKDYYNLLEVYLDAVFHPKLNEYSFLQEGWRLAVEKETKELRFKGIVYNEMKGDLSNPTSRLYEAINRSIFPDITYGVNSGGTPEEIPNLSYKDLLNFHQTYYHPSRCLFYFYGNLPLEEHLEFIQKNTLNDTPTKKTLPSIPLQKRFSNPVTETIEFPIPIDEDPSHKTLIGITWLACSSLDQKEILALTVLAIILMDTDSAPLKKEILESHLCHDAGVYFESEYSETALSIILQGCSEDGGEKIHSLIEEALKRIVTEGIDPSQLNDAIHQLEFHRSEISGNSYPFGLTLFMRCGLFKQHGGPPELGLQIHSLFSQLRETLREKPDYLESLINKYLLENSHRSIVTAVPSKEVAQKEEAIEREKLSKITSILSFKEIEQLINKNEQLDLFQKEQENQDIEVLPKVTLDDVPEKPVDYTLSQEKLNNLQIYHHDVFTNGIVYATLSFEIPTLTDEQLPYLHLFTTLLTEMAAGGRTVEKTASFIQGNVGAIGANLSKNIHIDDPNQLSPLLHIRGKALYRKREQLFSLLKDFSSSADLTDKKRLKEVLRKHYSHLETSINHSALKYALNHSASNLSPATRLNTLWYGLPYFKLIRHLANNFDQEADALIVTLTDLQKQLFSTKTADLIITCTEEQYQEIKKESFYGIDDLLKGSTKQWKNPSQKEEISQQAFLIGSTVAFTGKVIPTVSYTHSHSPALSLASQLFDNLTLHPQIREQGGAYGAGTTYEPLSGTFSFYSYRDPNISSTLKTFTDAVDRIKKGDFNDRELEEAKLQMIQALDSPLAPGSRGAVAYHWMKEGLTIEKKQHFRDQLLQLTKEQIAHAVEEEISPHLSKGTPAVFTGRALIESENEVLKKEKKPTFDLINL